MLDMFARKMAVAKGFLLLSEHWRCVRCKTDEGRVNKALHGMGEVCA